LTETRRDTITLSIDGNTVEAKPGELLIEVAARSGIYIPRFCYHPRMAPVGACRMCLVHLQPGPPKPQTACTTPVAEGMTVETQFTNPGIEKAQAGVIEFLLANHPLDCPICDAGGECPLQDQTLDYGPHESRFVEPKRRFVKPVEISPLVNLDRERCILCYRCTRFCEELSGDTMIGVMQRGPRAYIYPFEGEIFDSYFSGNTVQICPVGALTSRTYRFNARPWDLHWTPTTCNLCASGCSMSADVRTADGRLARMTGITNEDTNEEWLCDKGRYGHEYVSSELRLSRPLVRRDGELVGASWDEAFGVLVERVQSIGVGKIGDEAPKTAMLIGGSLCDEDAYTAQKFARLVLRSNAVDHRLAGGMEASAIVPPRLTYDDVLSADHVTIVSADLREELPLLFLRLRLAIIRKGVRVAIAHPRAVALTELSAQHLAILPGTDAALGAAVAAALGQPVAAGAEALSASAGVPAGDVRALAGAMRDAERAVVLLGPGVVGDPDVVRAWGAVAQASGARLSWMPRRAGEYGALACGAHPDLLPGWRRVDDETDRAEIASVWGAQPPGAPGEDVAGILARARDGDLELLWIVGADVLRDVPDPHLGRAGIEGARFVVVQDVLRTELTELADVVLPAAAFAEREGTLTDWEGRRQAVRAAVDPPGAARADYAILAEAARRMARPIGCRTVEDIRGELERVLAREVPAPGGVDTVRVAVSQPDAEFPLRLCSYRLLYDAGTRVRHTDEIGRLTEEVFVEINPADASGAGIEDGAAVVVWSRHGQLTARAAVSSRVRAGVAFVPYLQPGGSAQSLMTWDDRSPGVRVEKA
jgi:NADH-quinone oxidoreductase subunit G